MAAGIDWFRWHHGTVVDPKLQLVARRSGASLPDVIAIWAALLETASQSSPRGSVESFDPEAFDVLFNFPEARSAAVLEALTARGMLRDMHLVAWEKRQPKREREAENSTDRVKEHRRRKRESQGETPRNTNETQETPREEKSREELLKASARSSRADAQTVQVVDGNGNPSASIIANLTADQSAVVVLSCKALRKMGAIRFNPGDEGLAALATEGFTAEQIARTAGEKALRDADLWNDPDVHPDLPDLLINGASQEDMRLTPAQNTALRAAVSQVSIGYIASALRGKRRDAQTKTSNARGSARTGDKPKANDNFEGKTYVGTAIENIHPSLRPDGAAAHG